MFGLSLFRRRKPVIGRLEQVSFPKFGIADIQAKIDTGAYRSSIHAHNIREVDGTLSFSVLDAEHPQYQDRRYSTKDFKVVMVKSSNGEVERRYKIKTDVIIRGNTFTTDFTLSDRASMRHPVLIGRKVLRHRFIVDVSYE